MSGIYTDRGRPVAGSEGFTMADHLAAEATQWKHRQQETANQLAIALSHARDLAAELARQTATADRAMDMTDRAQDRAEKAEARVAALQAELAEARSERQREHDLRVVLAGHLEALGAELVHMTRQRDGLQVRYELAINGRRKVAARVAALEAAAARVHPQWTCKCLVVNTADTCEECGRKRPSETKPLD